MGGVTAMLATGTLPLRPLPGRIDFTPLVTVVVALLVVRFVLGVRLTWPVVGAVVVVGTTLGWSIGAWGVVVPSAVAFIAGAVLTAPLRRRGQGGSPSSA
jgi:hypothetical protein